MLDRFHSKFHRHNHHTDYNPEHPDSSYDPIASPNYPFQGDFHVKGTLSASNVDGGSSLRVGGEHKGSIIAPDNTQYRQYILPNTDGVLLLDTTLTSYVSGLSAQLDVSTIPFIQSSVVWVDGLSGDDIAGVRDRADKPFKSLGVAQSMAMFGDVIHVHRGHYTDTNLGVDGVDWYFEPGVVIEPSTITSPIFTYPAIAYNVYGKASVYIAGNIPLNNDTCLVANFNGSNVSRDIVFEFDGIDISSSASIDPLPTTSVFSGTFSNKNISIRGNRINAPKMCAFNGFKALNFGYSAFININEFIVSQTTFYGSLHRLSTYITVPVLSASDYLYSDGFVNDSLTRAIFDVNNIYGSINKETSLGELYFDVFDFYITPRVGTTWNSTAGGELNVFCNNVTANVSLSVGTDTQINTDSLISVGDIERGIVYGGNLVVAATTIDTSGITSSEYSLFYPVNESSRLTVNVDEIHNESSSSTKLLDIDTKDSSVCNINANRITGGGDVYCIGNNNKVRLSVYSATNTNITFGVLGDSTDSVLVIDGMFNTLSSSNLNVSSEIGHINTSVYINSGTILESTGIYNIDVSEVLGDPINVYSMGTIMTNKTPIEEDSNFILQCGLFESSSAIQVPSF